MDSGFDVLRTQLREAVDECSSRGLVFAAKWAAEQLCTLSSDVAPIDGGLGVPIGHVAVQAATTPTLKHRLRGASRQKATAATDDTASSEQEQRERWMQLDALERDRVSLAKCLFDLREFDRAAFNLRDCVGPRARFLRIYAQYLASERRSNEGGEQRRTGMDGELVAMRNELQAAEDDGDLDAFGQYLLAMLLKALGQRQAAREMCVRSVRAYEYNWSAWLLLETCVDVREPIERLSSALPGGWMRHAFLAHFLLEAVGGQGGSYSYSNSSGDSGGSGGGSSNISGNVGSGSVGGGDEFTVHCQVLEQLFPQSHFVMGLRAVRHYNMREFEEARRLFAALQQRDPFRLELADVHSNILYVMEDRARLGELAHRCGAVDRFRPETCCVIGNYYSLRREHEKAVGYFRRALQLDSACLAAWTLMGHEYIELKNTAAAIDAYRHAVDVDERDYRAWYGLGQTYEMLNMPHYAAGYYARAAALRPYDSRMWCALASCYELAGQPRRAIDCYRRALAGSAESETLAVGRLARLHEAAGERRQAAYYYQLVCEHALKAGAQPALAAASAAALGSAEGAGGLAVPASSVGAAAGTGGPDEVAAACLFLATYEHERGRPDAAMRYLAQVVDGASSGGASQQRVDEARALMRVVSG
ncbi:anaphase-promoting complex component apc8 [Coemansia sp. Benny D115]|nr:anaphase-promoting complex component apc8 [Coemansia sp. Benny D115]